MSYNLDKEGNLPKTNSSLTLIQPPLYALKYIYTSDFTSYYMFRHVTGAIVRY